METESHDLADVLQLVHLRAMTALSSQAPTSDAVTWPSAHLAAVERVFYPAVLRHCPAARPRLRRQLAVDHRLHQELWCLDRRLTGNMASAATSVESLTARIRPLFEEHAAGEAELLDALCDVLDAPGQAALVDELEALMVRAPTRPHPSTPHVRLTDPLTFIVEGWVDRLRDALDNRTVPTPRRRRVTVPVGKWGAYLTAQPYPVERASKEEAGGRRPGKRV